MFVARQNLPIHLNISTGVSKAPLSHSTSSSLSRGLYYSFVKNILKKKSSNFMIFLRAFQKHPFHIEHRLYHHIFLQSISTLKYNHSLRRPFKANINLINFFGWFPLILLVMTAINYSRNSDFDIPDICHFFTLTHFQAWKFYTQNCTMYTKFNIQLEKIPLRWKFLYWRRGQRGHGQDKYKWEMCLRPDFSSSSEMANKHFISGLKKYCESP